jgi:hypothetical protein
MNKRLRTSAVLGTTASSLALGLLAASPALASSGWSRSTTGASASGSVYLSSNGYIHLPYTLDDTKADGDCAYLYAELQKYDEFGSYSAWVGGVGEKRVELCGASAPVKQGTWYWSVGSAVDPFTTKVRISLKVCRDVPQDFDNCSSVYISPSWNV